MIRVLLADDHNIVRDGISHILEKEPDISVIAQAENGRVAVKLAMELSPDIVLMDMGMPEMNGIEATRRIVDTMENCSVVILSMYSDKRFVRQALAAGAKGYLLKGCAGAELIRAIRAVAGKEVYVCSKIVDVIVNNYVKQSHGDLSASAADLTPREREVLQLMAEGKNTKEIAFMLEIGAKTVETYRQQLMRKLKIFNVASLTKYAVREGMTSLED